MSAKEIYVIVNPYSAAGKTAKNWKSYEDEFRRQFEDWEVAFTDGPGHAAKLATQAIKNGFEKIVAVGGDGTIHEVCQGFFKADGKPVKKPGEKGPKLGFIAAGTGSDFVKSLGLPKDVPSQIEVLKEGRSKIIDSGWLTYQTNAGKQESRAFINIADVGVGGEVVSQVNASGAKGFLAYNYYSIKTLVGYENKKVKITIDKEVYEMDINGLVVANGRYFGGGMKVAPHALLDDGLFDIIILHSEKKLEMILKFPKMKKGKHLHENDVTYLQGRDIKVESLDEKACLLDADGEQPGHNPVQFKMKPKSLAVLIP